MATLAELFNASSTQIYGRFIPQTPNSNQPFVSVKPDTDAARTRIKDDIRLFPVGVSVSRDYTRVSKFLTSGDGVLFTAKQALLQSANTFANTKIYNPVSPLLNTVPSVHAKRFISTDSFIQRTPGLLQNSTLASYSKATIPKTSSGFSSIRNTLVTLRDLASGELTRRANAAISNFTNQIYNNSRPEFVVFGNSNVDYNPRINIPPALSTRASKNTSAVLSINSITQKVTQSLARQTVINIRSLTSINNIKTAFSPKNIGKTFSKTNIKNTLSKASNILRTSIPAIQQPPLTSFIEAAKDFKQKQSRNTSDRLNTKYFGENRLSDWTNQPSTVVSYNNGQHVIGEGSVNKLYDTLNKNIAKDLSVSQKDRLNYDSIAGQTQPDIIKFVFSIPDRESVQFRAFISSIKESVKPEFSEQRYVGRTERFVTYGGAKRTVSLDFNIVAFSKDELDDMWTRVNYLTGLAFPRGVSDSGFMVPPLFRITAGQIYDVQPCYVDTLDYDLLDQNITFDIDKQVSQVINVRMNLTLLEKRSKFYNSPFYKITEELSSTQNKNNTVTGRLVGTLIPIGDNSA
jgi:hypothetical protein